MILRGMIRPNLRVNFLTKQRIVEVVSTINITEGVFNEIPDWQEAVNNSGKALNAQINLACFSTLDKNKKARYYASFTYRVELKSNEIPDLDNIADIADVAAKRVLVLIKRSALTKLYNEVLAIQ